MIKSNRGEWRPTVLSVEQALSMSFATLRFVHQGFRVIRLEPTPVPGRKSKGDPNRYIGRPVAGEDRHSYYVAPNVGKEAIAVNLKQDEGRMLLRRLVREIPVDIFCTNTLPARHEPLGMDYETLRGERPDLIWCCISAMGPGEPDVPGYDERAATGEGRRIDVSMAQVAVSWLPTFLPMLDMGSTSCGGPVTSTDSSSRSTPIRRGMAASTWSSGATPSGGGWSRSRSSNGSTRNGSRPTRGAGGTRRICTRRSGRSRGSTPSRNWPRSCAGSGSRTHRSPRSRRSWTFRS